MSHIRSFLCFLLLMSMLLSAHLPSAGASSCVPEWDHVQRELDCQGQKIVIDAITDTNLPEMVREYDASLRVMSEEKLRALVSVAAPGYENMPLVWPRAPGGDDDYAWSLKDEKAGVLASPGIAFGMTRYLDTDERFTAGTSYDFTHFYKEPVDPNEVEGLKELSYPDALKLLEPVLAATELPLGEPRYVKVYDVDTFYSNQKRHNEEWHTSYDYTWQASDGIYEMQYPVYIQGLPLHIQGSGLVVGKKSISYTSLDIILRADGTFLKVYMSDPIDALVATSPEAKPLSLEQILDVYAQFLSSYALPDYVEPRVSRVSLEYLVWLQRTGALPAFNLVPVWCFYMPERDRINPEGYDHVEYFNAVTGEHVNMD
ncbi:MAG: hypothetical protein IKZ98_04025 [Clostridia bacterium]|nr:hypothetical protein [Clostridia bacterium]